MVETKENSLIKRYGAEKVVAKIQGYVSSRRQQRVAQVLDNRLQSIQVALEMPTDIHNAFAVVRSCEVFGIVKIHIIAPERIVSSMRAISKGAMAWVEIVFYSDIGEFLGEMQQHNYRLVGALPQAGDGVDNIPINEPLCLILGNEHSGLSSAAKQACNSYYQIPMFGMTESLNLSVAAAISLYETTRRKRNALQQAGDLTPSLRKKLQAYYYLNSINSRLANALFPQ